MGPDRVDCCSTSVAATAAPSLLNELAAWIGIELEQPLPLTAPDPLYTLMLDSLALAAVALRGDTLDR